MSANTAFLKELRQFMWKRQKLRYKSGEFRPRHRRRKSRRLYQETKEPSRMCHALTRGTATS